MILEIRLINFFLIYLIFINSFIYMFIKKTLHFLRINLLHSINLMDLYITKFNFTASKAPMVLAVPFTA